MTKNLIIFLLITLCTSLSAEITLWNVSDTPDNGCKAYLRFRYYEDLHREGDIYYYRDDNEDAAIKIYMRDDPYNLDQYKIQCRFNNNKFTIFGYPDDGGEFRENISDGVINDLIVWESTLFPLPSFVSLEVGNRLGIRILLRRKPLGGKKETWSEKSFILYKDTAAPELGYEIIAPGDAIGPRWQEGQEVPGEYGWYNMPVAIKLTQVDTVSGPDYRDSVAAYYIDSEENGWNSMSLFDRKDRTQVISNATIGNREEKKDEGMHTVYFFAWDNVDNKTKAYPVVTRLDFTPPEMVTGLVTSIESVEGEHGSEFSAVLLEWNEVTNDPGGSGLHHYGVSWRRSGTTGDFTELEKVINTAFSLDIDRLDRGVYYDIAVRPVDLVENAAEWTVKPDVFIPPKVQIQQIDTLPVKVNGNGEPVYTTVITLDRGTEVLQYITDIPIVSDGGNLAGGENSVFSHVDENGTVSFPWGKDDDGNLTFTVEHTGKGYAHRLLTYHVYTVHSEDFDFFEEYGNSLDILLPNYAAPFEFIVKEVTGENEVYIGRVDKHGFILDPDNTDALCVNKKLRFYPAAIDENGDILPDGKDCEGDRLKFGLYTINDTALPMEPVFADTGEYIELELSLSKLLHLYGAVTECFSDGDSLASLYGTELYKPQMTVHTVEGEVKGFYVLFDQDPPAGTFRITSLDGTVFYSVVDTTCTHEAALLIPAHAITDATGAASSELESIWVYNSDISELSHPEEINEYDLGALEEGEKLHKQQAPLDLTIPREYVPDDPVLFDWNLIPSAGPGLKEYRMSVMEIKDHAGNIHYSWQIVTLDTRIPPAPALSTFHHIHEDLVIHILWDPPAPGFLYEVSCPLIAGSPVPVSEPGITIPVDGCTPDREIDVTVMSVNEAGNRSPGVVYTVYTLPEPGTLSGAVQGYTEADGHFLEWALTGGSAKEQELAVLDDDGSLAGSLVPDNGMFRHTHLTAHQSYTYTLIAYNSFVPANGGKGDPASGEPFTVTLANNPPAAPQVLSPLAYASPLSVFSWEGSITDIDGDPVTYHVFVEDGKTSVSGSAQGTSYAFPQGSFTTCVLYDWYVVADDTPGPGYSGPAYTGEQAGSEHVSILFDGEGPVIELADFPGTLFISRDNLTITVTDAVSGVSGATYVIVDDYSSNIPEEIVLTGGTGSIPLYETSGSFDIILTALDNAGNITTIARTLRVDVTDPVIQDSEVDIFLPVSQGRYLCNNGKVPVSVTGMDTYSGIRELRYGFADQSGGIIDTWNIIIIEEIASPGGNTEPVLFEDSLSLAGTDGSEYFLAVCFSDHAGNTCEPVYPDSAILYDTSPAGADLSVEGLVSRYGGFYTPGNNLTVTFIAEDPHSGATPFMTVTGIEGITRDTPWYSSWEDAKTYAFEDGKQYIISGKAVNGTGLETMTTGMPFIFDSTAPCNLVLDLDTGYEYMTGEQVRLTARAEEPHSPPVSFTLGIGSTPGETDISMMMPGNADGWLEAPARDTTALFIFTIPGIPDGTYFVCLKAENAAGLSSGISGPAFTMTVNNTQEKIIVRDPGPYQSRADIIEASWEYRGPGTVTGYQYRIHITGESEPDWISTNQTFVRETGLSLENGTEYYVEARAAFADSTFSVPGRSAGVLVDTTSPVFDEPDGLITPAACTFDHLTLLWNGRDDESGLGTVQVLLEAADNTGEPVPGKSGWIAIPVSSAGAVYHIVTDASGHALALETGWRVTLTVRLTNNAGLTVERKTPDIIIDNTPPPIPFVTDQGDAICTGQAIEASWLWTEDDPESMTVHYQWTVVRSGAELPGAVWYDDDGTKQATTADIPFSGVHGEVWYVGVRALNGAGLVSIGMSNGIVYDDTAPHVASVKLIDGAAGTDPGVAEELYYVPDNENLQLYIDAYEDISGITYSVRAGTWDSEKNFVPLPGISIESTEPLINLPSPLTELMEGSILVFEAECRNEAGLVEYGYSRGVILDTGAPVLSGVEGFYSDGLLYFQWEKAESISPVTMYAVSLTKEGNQPGEWTEMGIVTGYTINADTAGFADGKYTLWVKAGNAAGRWTGVPQRSNTVIVDRSPPEVLLEAYSRFASTQIDFTVHGDDPDSGIAGYEYRLGTIDVPDLFTGTWISIPESRTDITHTIVFSELPGGEGAVPHNTVLFLEVRVKNNTGLFSVIEKSGAIPGDKTVPETPVVHAGDYTRFEYMIGDISFSCADNESGITHYAVAITDDSSPAGLEPAEWKEYSAGIPGEYLPSIDITGYEQTGLALSHGGLYYCAVKVKNGAGQWSLPGVSEVIRADFTPPVLAFTGEGTVLVVNDVPYTVPYTLADEVSDTVTVTFTLVFLNTGTGEQYEPEVLAPGNLSFLFTGSTYGLYRLEASLVDAAGNHQPEIYYQELRVNEPPRVTMESITTTPGKPLILSAFIYDPDGDAPFAYEWDFESDGITDSTGTEPETFYLHNDSYATVSTYTLTLVVTDSAGKCVTNITPVVVENTSRGRLYVDEYWAGTHYIRGDIMIPEGITLTIRENTGVIITGDPFEGYDHRLTVEGILEAGTGTVFEMEQGIYDLWNGIYISGNAVMNGVTIKNAQRGLTLVRNSTIDISNCSFIDNRTGIHLPGASPEIRTCLFEHNSRYAIKE
ncbi:MAG: hypothetical protein JXB88_13695, partial [Spirochaetales bacterium]|nr:hypothetical protein [Spirochaetales bacterium]